MNGTCGRREGGRGGGASARSDVRVQEWDKRREGDEEGKAEPGDKIYIMDMKCKGIVVKKYVLILSECHVCSI